MALLFLSSNPNPSLASPPPLSLLLNPIASSTPSLPRRSRSTRFLSLLLPRPHSTSHAVSSRLSPIFLPHLELQEEMEEVEEGVGVEDLELESEDFDSEGAEGEEEDGDGPDPIRNFFESRTSAPDPDREGRVSFQRNRRSSWHIAPGIAATKSTSDGEADGDDEPDMELVTSSNSEPQVSTLLTEDGAVQEILKIARNLPENSTLNEFLEPYTGKIGEGDCIELLKRMGEEGLVFSCMYLFEWMGLQKPLLLTPRACSVLFPMLGKAGMGDKLMAFFENLPKARRFRDVHVYNAAISGLSCCKRYNDAWKVFEAMETNNVMLDHVTCSSLITVMRKTGRSAKEAWEFFEKMNRKGVKWRLEVFGALIKSFCAEGLKKEALIIQSEMEKKGIPSNVIIYNTLMDAYVKSDQVEDAEGLFDEMKEKGLTPTTATYNILMDAYSRRMQPNVVENLLVEMKSLGLKPNVKSYTCLVSAYGRHRKMSDLAADAFLRMKKIGIKPTSHSYTALIHAYSVGGWHEKALTAFENMKREGILPCIETYTALLDAFRRAGDPDMLVKIWKLMNIDKIDGTRVTFNILLDGLAKQGMYVQARDVVHEFGRLGIAPTVMTYNILMNAYARGGQHNKLPQLLKEMAALTLKPDSITYSTVIYAYARVRDYKKAFFYHKEMVRNGQVPDARQYQKMRAILDVKAAIRNRRDKSAILGIVNSKMGLLKPKGKKDEFWKNKNRRSETNRIVHERHS